MASAPVPTILFSSPAGLFLQLKPTDLQRPELVFQTINSRFDGPLTSADMAHAVGLTANSFCAKYTYPSKNGYKRL